MSKPVETGSVEKTGVLLRGVTKRFRSGPETLTILNELDFSAEAGSCIAITGPSGSGKTTLLNIIGGLDHPDSGTVLLSDLLISGLDEEELARVRSERIGFVFQFHYLLKDFTAAENVMLPAYMKGVKRRAAITRAKDLLGQVGLSGRIHHFPHQLSGGERQRVALARALVNEPSVLLADEPTGNLDPDHAAEVSDLIFSVRDEFGTTMIIVSHDESTAARAEKHYILEGGALKQL